jgi:hypothetical protein
MAVRTEPRRPCQWALPALAIMLGFMRIMSVAAKSSSPAYRGAPPPSSQHAPCGAGCDNCLESRMTTPGGVAFQKHECSNPAPPATQPNPDAASPDWKPVIDRPEPTVAPVTSGGQLPPGYIVVPVVMQPCGLSCAKCTSQSSTRNGTTVTLYSCADPPSKRAGPGPARAPVGPLSPTGASLPYEGPRHPDSQRSNNALGAATAEGAQCQNGETFNSDYNVCTEYTGAMWTAMRWPCQLVRQAWSQCDEKSCRSDTIVPFIEHDVNCQGTGRDLVLSASFKGLYHGWEDRHRLISAALATQDGQCGFFSNGFWSPTQITLRDYATEAWINMDFKGVCQDPGASVKSVGDLSQTLASTLDWNAISALEYVHVI